MNNFIVFATHFSRLNFCIGKYAFKTVVTLFKTDHILGTPNENGDFIPTELNEFDCCTDYAKKLLAACIVNHSSSIFKLYFDFDDLRKGLILPPDYDCLAFVAKEVGFEVVSEDFDGLGYTYTIQNAL